MDDSFDAKMREFFNENFSEEEEKPVNRYRIIFLGANNKPEAKIHDNISECYFSEIGTIVMVGSDNRLEAAYNCESWILVERL